MTDRGVPAEMSGGEMTKHTGDATGTTTAVARTRYEMEAAVVLARANPRDEDQAIARIKRSCERIGFAFDVEFEFTRGGKDVTGPSVIFAREAARCWGNIRYGLHIYSSDGDQVHIRGYAFDAETGAFTELEDRFQKLVERAEGRWIVPNERQLRELIFRRGAILERNCILKVMPPDQVEDCITVSRTTIHKWGGEALKKDRKGSIQLMVKAFQKIGVKPEQLDEYLKIEIRQITTEQYVKLKRIYKGIEEGQTSVAEHFGEKRPAASSGSINPDAGMQPTATEPKPSARKPAKPKTAGQVEAEANIERLRKEAEKKDAKGGGRQGRPSGPQATGPDAAATPPEASADQTEAEREQAEADHQAGDDSPEPEPSANCQTCGNPLTGEETDWLEAECVPCHWKAVGAAQATETKAAPAGDRRDPLFPDPPSGG